MRIREGSFNNKFVSETTYLDFKIHDNISEFVGKKDLLLSSISNNNFSIPINFGFLFSSIIEFIALKKLSLFQSV